MSSQLPVRPPTRHAATLPTSPRPVTSANATDDADENVNYVMKRGTLDDYRVKTMIDDHPQSFRFQGLDLSGAALRKLPRRIRPYYERMALLQSHYEEVDTLLAGELPVTIASGFAANANLRTLRAGDRRTSSVLDVPQEEDEPLLPKSVSIGEARDRHNRWIININTVINVLLVAAKGVAVLSSSSVSLLASLVDSALDLLSTFIILGTSMAMGVKDTRKYPTGKRRFEPLGVLVFSVAMIASFVQVFIESVKRCIEAYRGEAETETLSWIGMSTMLATIIVKGMMWFLCSNMQSSSVQALAQDAENDVWLNIMSLSFPFLGGVLRWRLLDPIGGIVLSSYIIIEWIKTLLDNFGKLSGHVASSDQITRALYLVTRFTGVTEISSIECYHIGDEILVEVDIILPQNTSLHIAHDLGETVQCMLESLDGVLRAYVHCDYSSTNPPQHGTRSVAGNG